tara:strand:+ start:199 stop:534 length:336 start_codon:yes stop_codon:yes gene_type:complete
VYNTIFLLANKNFLKSGGAMLRYNDFYSLNRQIEILYLPNGGTIIATGILHISLLKIGRVHALIAKGTSLLTGSSTQKTIISMFPPVITDWKMAFSTHRRVWLSDRLMFNA